MSMLTEAFGQSPLDESSPWNGARLSLYDGNVTKHIRKDSRPMFEQLLARLGPVVGHSFGQMMAEDSDDGLRPHVENVDAIAFLEDAGVIAGFASAKYLAIRNTFYLHGIALHPNVKGKGGSKALISALKTFAPASPIAFTTQNPVMFDVLSSLYANAYPNPVTREMPEELRSIACQIMQYRTCRYDARTSVASDMYDSCLYRALPTSRNQAVNEWFAQALRVENQLTRAGFLLIGT
jgi:hypothetical protein